MRPHLLLLVRMLRAAGVNQFEALYTDPIRYAKSENTTFTDGPVLEVRQVAGYEGSHVADSGTSDLLVIGAGYDHELVQWVSDSKMHARKLLMFGLPSLQPDMYQESRLRIARASASEGEAAEADLIFAPANNPSATAQHPSSTVDLGTASARESVGKTMK